MGLSPTFCGHVVLYVFGQLPSLLSCFGTSSRLAENLTPGQLVVQVPNFSISPLCSDIIVHRILSDH